MDHWTGIITEDWIRAQFVGPIPGGSNPSLGSASCVASGTPSLSFSDCKAEQ